MTRQKAKKIAKIMAGDAGWWCATGAGVGCTEERRTRQDSGCDKSKKSKVSVGKKRKQREQREKRRMTTAAGAAVAAAVRLASCLAG